MLVTTPDQRRPPVVTGAPASDLPAWKGVVACRLENDVPDELQDCVLRLGNISMFGDADMLAQLAR
jgi:hypothetical protein